jgi:surface polysaccharide O-acyltransferase-like enzyme
LVFYFAEVPVGLFGEAKEDSNGKADFPVDLIRTIAIFLVILLHASNQTLELPVVSQDYWWTAVVYKTLSLSCVPLFIMLSGSLLLQPKKLEEPIRVFLKKRLSRIGLAFAFWTGVYLVWGFFLSHQPVTWPNVIQATLFGVFSGSYYHFWFLYLIIGLYLVTPILRAIIANGNWSTLRYLIILWFVAVAVVPIIQLAGFFTFYTLVFLIIGWIGYFALGAYLQKVKIQSVILYVALACSFVWTLLGVWVMTYPLAYMDKNSFFFDYLTANVIIGSIALFMILIKIRPANWPETKHSTITKLIKVIGQNTLPIFLLHVIILESLQRGFFGFTISVTTLNPIIEIPLITVITLFITLGLILLMRKVPVLRKLIG